MAIEIFLFLTSIADFSKQMDSQPLELIPDGNIFFEIGLELLELLLLEDKSGLGNDDIIDLVVFLESQQQL